MSLTFLMWKNKSKSFFSLFEVDGLFFDIIHQGGMLLPQLPRFDAGEKAITPKSARTESLC